MPELPSEIFIDGGNSQETQAASTLLKTLHHKIFQEWIEQELPMPDETFAYNMEDLDRIAYQDLTLDQDWRNYNLDHDLTDVGLTRFMQDWRSIIK